jgi:hypothetical protein
VPVGSGTLQWPGGQIAPRALASTLRLAAKSDRQ